MVPTASHLPSCSVPQAPKVDLQVCLSSLPPSKPHTLTSLTYCLSFITLTSQTAGVHLQDTPFGPPCLSNTTWKIKFQVQDGIATSQLLSSSGTKVALPGLPHYHYPQSPLVFHHSHNLVNSITPTCVPRRCPPARHALRATMPPQHQLEKQVPRPRRHRNLPAAQPLRH
jgi:hypothetical protein